ncbi:MAG: tRNA dihydrouridine synthase DusB [Oscillospiraceae bacterium]|nr:tRNA dihydrouridine synthase DusB [Oscillospiraceae bacterium]
MAGVSDKAFRALCKQHGCDYTITEMVSAKALVYQDKKTVNLLGINDGEHPCAVQIFGSDPSCMAEAADKALALSAANIIDINMGCPTPKIVNNGDGSALMKAPELARDIVEHVVRAVKQPVTVKIRLGWDKGSINCVEFAKMLEQAGASALAVHGRTRSMQYSGIADHDTIRLVKEAVSVPVWCNGDIRDGTTAKRALAISRCDGLMIGRAAFGNPWLFAEIKAALAGEVAPSLPSIQEIANTVSQQFEMARQHRGDKVAILEMRKHFAWYLHGRPYMQEVKRKINAMQSAEDFYAIAKKL